MINNSQKGISLIMAFFIMIIILSVILSISILLYSEIKVIRNIGNSVISFYAADSGIEKVLFYDRQVLPNNKQNCKSDDECVTFPYTLCKNNLCTIPSSRGLCSMLSPAIANFCTVDEYPNNPIEHSIYCNFPQVIPGNSTGCDFNICDNCTIKFATTFDNRGYFVTAAVNSSYYLIVESEGNFEGTERKIQVTIPFE